MLPLLPGILGFLLYLIYDINSFTRQNRIMGSFFTVGSVLIALSTVWMLRDAWHAGAIAGFWDFLLLTAAVLAFAALIYALFFALPFDDTYVSPENGRTVCDTGVYALCRHPGILCFFALYLFLGLASLPHPMICGGMLLSALNTAYAAFQDRITFPRTFCDYDGYRHRVPFLIPTKDSIRTAGRTLPRLHGKKESK